MAKKNKNLTDRTMSGVLWMFAENFLAQLISTVVSIILARMLMPDDYGIVALLLVFINIANVFVTAGFASALIQKDKVDEIEYSSILYISLTISIVLYMAIFFCAPLISNLYDNSALTPMIRVFAIKLPLAAIANVQHARISRTLNFKKLFWASFLGTVLAGIVGVVMAKTGFGAWALIAQYLTNTVVDIIVLGIVLKWVPKFAFSFKKVKGLLSYGWKMLASSLIDTGYTECRSLIIGVKYSPTDLAYYNKGGHYPALIVGNVNNSLSHVLFSSMSRVQDDRVKIKNATKKAIRCFSYLIFPCMAGLAAVAVPFVRVILLDKWLPVVPYIYIFCFTYALFPLHTTNLSAIQAVGRSDVFLKLEIIKKTVGITVILVSMWFGVFWLALSGILSSIASVFINSYPNKKLLNYSLGEQLLDVVPALLLSLAMAVPVFFMSYIPINLTLLLILQVITGIGLYILLSVITKNKEFKFILGYIKRYFKKKRVQNVDATVQESEDGANELDATKDISAESKMIVNSESVEENSVQEELLEIETEVDNDETEEDNKDA